MKHHPSLFWTGLFLLGPLLGCSAMPPGAPEAPTDPRAERALAPEIQADAATLAKSNNRFALDLYSRLRSGDGNLFFSPYSISTAFAMVRAGAAGETEREIANVFHFEMSQEKLHPTFGALQKSLDRGVGLGGYELSIANRAWGQQGFPFRAAFLDVTRDHYGAELQQADFLRDAEAARRAANRWVEDRTRQKIVELFPVGSIHDGTRLVLANAIYFKGRWAREFDQQRTADAQFHLNVSQAVTVPTMKQEATFRIAHADDAQMLELSYRGEDLSMLILLPGRIDGLEELEAGLTLERIQQMQAGLVEKKVMVALPRFRFVSKFTLPRVLSEMGMPSVFLSEADLSGIDGRRDLFISAAFHQGFVEVNEEGTEAAAATGVVGGITSVPPSFIANHPFVFMIYDHVTQSILFIGRVTDPRAA